MTITDMPLVRDWRVTRGDDDERAPWRWGVRAASGGGQAVFETLRSSTWQEVPSASRFELQPEIAASRFVVLVTF